jgi:hypothetical protein
VRVREGGREREKSEDVEGYAGGVMYIRKREKKMR